jgi:hypothetical protein
LTGATQPCNANSTTPCYESRLANHQAFFPLFIRAQACHPANSFGAKGLGGYEGPSHSPSDQSLEHAPHRPTETQRGASKHRKTAGHGCVLRTHQQTGVVHRNLRRRLTQIYSTSRTPRYSLAAWSADQHGSQSWRSAQATGDWQPGIATVRHCRLECQRVTLAAVEIASRPSASAQASTST